MNQTSATTGQQPTQRPLKVVFLSNSDNLGGAAVVTRRLVQALNGEGIDARMLVFYRLSDDKCVEGVKVNRLRRGWEFMTERLRIAMSNGFSRENLFKVSIANTGLPVSKHPLVRDADVVVLSWINQGFVSLREIEKIGRMGKPIVWVMHDMWNLTGICHHALDCRAYKKECGHCQFLTGNGDNDLSHKVWRRKKHLYDNVPITFVAVSSWLAKCCRESGLMCDRDLRVIPNAFPIKSFYTSPQLELPKLPSNTEIILMGAARLDDSIKGLDIAIDSLNHLFDNHPEVARRATAVFFGSIRDRSIFDNLRFPHVVLGPITDDRILRDIYARTSVVISTSHYETLPGTLIEGQAAGALPVTFGRGGQADIVDHKVNGYIARYKDIDDFADGIIWALNANTDRNRLHDQVGERFSSHAVACKFIELFEELAKK
ncbi:MAG: glycosyltransferase [Bacteroides sp.]|nr:glycosyltransferase [Bacteroides sp.]MCM1413759.1 glycosyltransferase [Bacteroides sp.]MCM1472222.1 glycosyltransferase [Bacteroides sp.]